MCTAFGGAAHTQTHTHTQSHRLLSDHSEKQRKKERSLFNSASFTLWQPSLPHSLSLSPPPASLRCAYVCGGSHSLIFSARSADLSVSFGVSDMSLLFARPLSLCVPLGLAGCCPARVALLSVGGWNERRPGSRALHEKEELRRHTLGCSQIAPALGPFSSRTHTHREREREIHTEIHTHTQIRTHTHTCISLSMASVSTSQAQTCGTPTTAALFT